MTDSGKLKRVPQRRTEGLMQENAMRLYSLHKKRNICPYYGIGYHEVLRARVPSGSQVSRTLWRCSGCLCYDNSWPKGQISSKLRSASVTPPHGLPAPFKRTVLAISTPFLFSFQDRKCVKKPSGGSWRHWSSGLKAIKDMEDNSADGTRWARGRKEVNTSNDQVLTHPTAKTESLFQHMKREGDGKKGASKLTRAQQSLLTLCSSITTWPFPS